MTEPGIPEEDIHEQMARLRAFLSRTLGFWRTTGIVVALGVASAAVFLWFRTPRYRSETVILYTEGVRSADDQDRSSESARSVTVRLKELLLSRTSLSSVVKEFGLYPDVRKKQGLVDAVDELRRDVEFRAPGGDTFSIAFTGASPSEAQRVTSRLAALVIDQDSDLRKKQALVARDFLVKERESTEAGLHDAEQQLAAFMGRHPRFALDATPFATGAAIRASMGAVVAGTQTPSARGFRSVPRAPGAGAPVPGGAASAAPGSKEALAEEAGAAAALAAAQANLTELSNRFTDAHPDVRSARAEFARAKARLEEARTATAALPKPAVASVFGEAPLVPETPAVQAAAPPRAGSAQPAPPVVVPADTVPRPAPRTGGNDVVALETEWVKLTRGVTEARQHQDQVEGALFKANIAASSETGGHGVQVTMIDPPFLPHAPLPPGKSVIAAGFLAAALCLGFLTAAIRALLDDRVRTGRDVRPFAELLVEIPRANRRANVPS